MSTLSIPKGRKRWENLAESFHRPALALPAEGKDRYPQVFARGQIRKNPTIIWDIADAKGGQRLGRFADDRPPEEAQRRGRRQKMWWAQAGQAAQSGCLAGAIAGQQGDGLPSAYGKATVSKKESAPIA